MLLASLERLRAVPRLAEIARTLMRFGLHDLVHSVGLHRVLADAGGIVGWKPDPAMTALPLPERVRLALEALGPAFVKLGQVLASRVDLLAPEWIASLDQLHDHATPVPFAALEHTLVRDLGKPVAEAFVEFDVDARAAGSIAQVHRGLLPDGSVVAVKIRRPGVEVSIEADVLLLEIVAAWWEEEDRAARRWQPAEIVRQLRKSLTREVDFAAEARAQQRFADSFRDSPVLVIPRVHPEFTRGSLLVMDWVDGIAASDMAAVNAAGFDCGTLAARGTDALLQMVLIDGFFHADPHPGNVFFLPGERIALIDFGMVGWISEKRRNELIDLMAALAARDADSMRDVLIAWADGSRVSAERFAEDLGRMLHLYEHASLREIRLATLLTEIAGVMREHHLVMPADLALLFKALITLEGLGTRLVPEFRLIERVTPVVERIVAERWHPRRAAQRLRGVAQGSGRAMRAVPRILETLARRVADENFAVRLEMREVDNFSRHLEGGVNRLTIGLVTAALIVGSSIILAVSTPDQRPLAWFLGLVGFVVSFANSLWLIATIRRSRRP